MADVYVNALTTISTEPTTTDSIVAVNRNTNEGKIIDYNKLADAILNKIASKQYSGLNTTSKLLVGAINELDSDVASLNTSLSGVDLPTAGDTFRIGFDAIIIAVSTSRCYAVLFLPFYLKNTNYSVNITAPGSVVNVGTPTPTIYMKRQSNIMFFIDAPTEKNFY